MSTIQITSATALTHASMQGVRQQRKLDFQAVKQDIKSGNLAGAQSALMSYQQDTQQLQTARNTRSTPWMPGAGPLASDKAVFLNAVQSGDLAGAQSALTQYQTANAALTTPPTQTTTP